MRIGEDVKTNDNRIGQVNRIETHCDETPCSLDQVWLDPYGVPYFRWQLTEIEGRPVEAHETRGRIESELKFDEKGECFRVDCEDVWKKRREIQDSLTDPFDVTVRFKFPAMTLFGMKVEP